MTGHSQAEARPEACSATVNSEPSMATPPREMSRPLWLMVVVSLMASMFLFALDNTVVADIQPSIVRSLGEVDRLPWVSVSYALGGIADTLLYCNLFTHFDNKRLFLSGVILFEIGSVVCGAAPTMTALIVGRVICGLGGTGIYIGALNLLSLLTSEAERPIYLGISGLTWGLGTILGPVIGGAFAASKATWRWCFYLNLCVGGLSCPVYFFLIPRQDPRPGISTVKRLGDVDFVGAVLNAGAAISPVMAIAFGGGLYAWSSAQIIALFVVTGTLSLAFFFQQYFALFTTKAHQLFPVVYLRSWSMTNFFFQIACGITTVFVPLYFIPLFFQFGQNESSLNAAVHLLPLVCFQVLGTIIGGALLQKVGYYMVFYLAGSILALIGGALFLTIDLDTSTSAIYGYSVLVGLGGGLFTQISFPVAQLKVSRNEIASVVTFLGFGQITGITLALAISSSFFLNDATARIAVILPDVPRNIVQQAILGTDDSVFDSLSTRQRQEVLQAIVKPISHAFGMVVAAAALAFILATTMKRERLQPTPSTGNQNDEVEMDENPAQVTANGK